MTRILAQGMSAAARAADIAQSDREYIAQRQQRNAKKAHAFVTSPCIDSYYRTHDTEISFADFTARMKTQAERHDLFEVAKACSSDYWSDHLRHLSMDFIPIVIGEWDGVKYILIRGEVTRFDWDDCLNVT